MAFNYDDYIDLLIQKDEHAFNLVYDASHKTIFAVIKSIVKSQTVTEDLMQDTYMKAIAKIHTYKRNKKFLSWLSSIAHNLAIDYYRVNNRVSHIDIMDNENLFPADAPRSDQDHFIFDIMSTLTDEVRQIVLLHIVGEETFINISKTLNKPLGTVLWLYNKGLKQLKKEAKKYEA